jgi:hypothetical protein
MYTHSYWTVLIDSWRVRGKGPGQRAKAMFGRTGRRCMSHLSTILYLILQMLTFVIGVRACEQVALNVTPIPTK